MLRATSAALLLAGLPGACGGNAFSGPAQTAWRAAYFESPPEPVHAAVLQVLERWKVRIRSDDGRIIRSHSFKDGSSVWRLQVELAHSGGTTAVLARMDLLKGGSVEADVVETDYEAIVRWQVGGDPDAFRMPAQPTHADRVKGELIDWLKRWRAGAAGSAEDPEHRARNRRELFLFCLRMLLPGG